MSYRSLHAPHDFVAEPIKGSRFHAHVAPAGDEAAAMAVVRSIEARFPDASHHCWAWRLASGASRVWDAGEPRGSAGRPILLQLEGHDLLDVVAVVTRWYGGTPLGVGGLMRAYGGAAGMAMDRATTCVVEAWVERELRFDFGDTNPVHMVLAQLEAQVLDTRYDTGVTLVVKLTAPNAERLAPLLTERTRGRATVAD